MNKQRKIVFVGTMSAIMTLTMLPISYYPATAYGESVVNERVSNGFYMEDFKKQLDTDYHDVLIEEEISEDEETFEDTNKYLLNGYENSGVKVTVQKEKKKESKNTYSAEDLKLLSGIVQNEAGSDYCSNYHQQCIASIVINRVKSDKYPDSIHDVIFQKDPTQYAIGDGFYNPTKRAIKNAKYILENGSILPSNCLFQSEFKQGDGVYDIIDTPRSTTYICYKN
jgi:hypothetical protein